jgi:hypothetical protein
VAFIVAVTHVAEVGDFARFANPRQLMAYLGLVPAEHSSGRAVRRAGIAKAGNALARRALIEGAWTYRIQPRVSRKLHDRLEGLPQVVRDIAWKAQVRLCARYRRLAAAGKPKVVVTTAIAREMLGFVGDRSLRPGRPAPHQLTPAPTMPTAGGGARPGILARCYEPAPPTLTPRPRQPKTKPRSRGSQPAHESLLNRCLWPRLPPWA